MQKPLEKTPINKNAGTTYNRCALHDLPVLVSQTMLLSYTSYQLFIPLLLS